MSRLPSLPKRRLPIVCEVDAMSGPFVQFSPSRMVRELVATVLVSPVVFMRYRVTRPNACTFVSTPSLSGSTV